MTDQPILVAGAGIGGLAAALALAERGFRVEVLERRDIPAETGAGIQVGPNGTRVLRALGLEPALAPVVARPERIIARSGLTGAVITELPLGAWIEARHGAPYWTMHRRDLHRALWTATASQPAVTVTLGFEVVAVSETADTIEVTAADGRRTTGALLVGADGLWSTVRTLIVPDARPQPGAKCATRAVVAMDRVPADLRGLATGLWLAPGSHLVHYPVNAGRDLALVLVADDPGTSVVDGWDGEVSASWLDCVTRSLPTAARDLVSAGTDWRRWRLYELPALARWSRGRAVLLGDAAHPVLPFLAQGAALALEDAVVLADRLAAHAFDLPRAAEQCADHRIARTRRVANAARRNGQIYHLDGLAARARNLAMATAGGSRLMAGYDWLYGWRPPISRFA